MPNPWVEYKDQTIIFHNFEINDFIPLMAIYCVGCFNSSGNEPACERPLLHEEELNVKPHFETNFAECLDKYPNPDLPDSQ